MLGRSSAVCLKHSLFWLLVQCPIRYHWIALHGLIMALFVTARWREQNLTSTWCLDKLFCHWYKLFLIIHKHGWIWWWSCVRACVCVVVRACVRACVRVFGNEAVSVRASAPHLTNTTLLINAVINIYSPFSFSFLLVHSLVYHILLYFVLVCADFDVNVPYLLFCQVWHCKRNINNYTHCHKQTEILMNKQSFMPSHSQSWYQTSACVAL